MASLEEVLDSAEITLTHGNDWKVDYEGAQLWIGAPSGSRNGQFEAEILRNGRAIHLHSRSFRALKTLLKRTLKTQTVK